MKREAGVVEVVETLRFRGVEGMSLKLFGAESNSSSGCDD